MNTHWLPVVCLIAFDLTCGSCSESVGKIERKALRHPNATSHIFQLPISCLRDTLISSFDVEKQYGNPVLQSVFYYCPGGDKEHKQLIVFQAETIKHALFGSNYFKKLNTENDIYLHDFGNTWNSPLYQVNGKPLEYRAAFILKLKSVDENRTLLVIDTENPMVINGTVGWGPHGSVARKEKVQPTTIEEHSLLLYIAGELRDDSVAPLKWPVP
ncbi:MAG TPA: hypothetical protein VF690_00750 [Hymenobacter sp.]|jgi:hypothetical protein